MDVRQLRCIVQIAASGSLSAAAEALRTSQSSLSYHVRRLEQEVGVRLLKRHARGVSLTPAGEALLSEAEAVLARLEGIAARLAPFRTAPRPLRIDLGVTPTAGRVLGPEILDLAPLRSRLSIVLHERLASELVPMLRAGRLDAALSYVTPGSEDLISRPLYREDLHLVGPPGLVRAEDGDVALAALMDHPLVIDPRGHHTRELLERAASDRGLAFGCDIEVAPGQLKRELILHHGKCSVVPYGFLQDELRAGQLQARRVCDPVLSCRLNLFFHDGLDAWAARLMQDAIAAIAGAHIAAGQLRWQAPDAD